MTNFNWVDYVILGIFLFSTLAGLMRGFLRELFALITWVIAFFVSAMYATKLANYFMGSSAVQSMLASASDSMGKTPAQSASLLAVVLSFIGIFITILIIGKVIGYLFSTAATPGGGGLVNRLLGAVFGLARGVLIVILMVFLLQMTPAKEQSWWSESTFVNYFQPSVKWLNESIQPGLDSVKSKMDESMKKVNETIQHSINTQ